MSLPRDTVAGGRSRLGGSSAPPFVRQLFGEHCATVTHHRVRVGETDMMGVVHHAEYVGFLEAGRIEYMRRRGFPYQDIVSLGLHMPVIGLSLTYRKPARFDDLLAIETRLSLLGRVRVSFDYRVWKAEAGERVLLVEAQVALACVDASPRPRPLPEAIAQALLRPETSSPEGLDSRGADGTHGAGGACRQ